MVYIRGSRHDFDKWVKDGSEGWSYKDVLPYFLKSEDVQEKSLQASSESAPIEYHHLNIVHYILTVSFFQNHDKSLLFVIAYFSLSR